MKTIQLSVCNTKNKIYYLTSISEQEKETLLEKRENKTLKGYIINNENNEEIDADNILFLGENNKSSNNTLRSYIGVYYGPNTGDGRSKHYRDYGITEKRQYDNKHLLNHCPDITVSVKSALKKMDNSYCIIWQKDYTKKSVLHATKNPTL